jgi:hypothetical protein
MKSNKRSMMKGNNDSDTSEPALKKVKFTLNRNNPALKRKKQN